MTPDLEHIVTADGSVTFRDRRIGATYRSVHGAATESRHVFLQGTRLPQRPGPWRVLELGFGTGLNFQVTLEAAVRAGVELEYLSLEPSPLPNRYWQVDEPWREIALDRPARRGGITLTVANRRWQEYEPPADFFHAYYHDPFGPAQAPECWTAACFRWSVGRLTGDGILATFGAAGATRRAMKEAGYLVGRMPGALGKREMTVASKSAEAIAGAKPWKRDEPS